MTELQMADSRPQPCSMAINMRKRVEDLKGEETKAIASAHRFLNMAAIAQDKLDDHKELCKSCQAPRGWAQ